MSKRLTIDDLKLLVESRNHKIISMDDYTGVKFKVKFFCNTCNNSFITSVASYKNSRKTGCTHCKKISISQVHKGKKVSTETRTLLSKKAKGRVGSLKGRYGTNHPAWKGTPARDFRNPSTDYYIWRQAVIKRFNRTCAITGKKSRLVVHHLYSWNAYPDKRYSVTNGILLHREVHKSFHNQYGYGNNTEEQFSQFIKEQYGMEISSQATHDTCVEGSETTGGTKRGL